MTSNNALNALLTAAAALPACLATSVATPAHAAEGSAMGASYLYYKESDGRMKVLEPIVWIKATIADVWELGASATVDTMSGASPRAVVNDTGKPYQSLSSASIRDKRTAGDARLRRTFAGSGSVDTFAVGLSHAQSKEDDYRSKAWGLEAEIAFNNKATTLSAGFGTSKDRVGSSENPTLDAPRSVREFTLGLSQVINANAIAQSVVEVSRGKGFYDDPYKLTFTTNFNADGTLNTQRPFFIVPDTRPNSRRNVAWLNKLRLNLPDRHATLQADLRLAKDSWGVSSQTLELNWVQRIGDQWKITPGVRYYSQSAADFYAPIIISLPRQYQSSDQRLAAFGSFTPSIKASWQVSPGTVFEASYARLIQQGNWKLGGGGTSTFERFSADLLTVGVVHQF